MLPALNGVIRINGRVQSVRDLDERSAFLRAQNMIFLEIGLGVPVPSQFDSADAHRSRQSRRNGRWEYVAGRDIFRPNDIALHIVAYGLDGILIGFLKLRA